VSAFRDSLVPIYAANALAVATTAVALAMLWFS